MSYRISREKTKQMRLGHIFTWPYKLHYTLKVISVWKANATMSIKNKHITNLKFMDWKRIKELMSYEEWWGFWYIL